mmetsp:Transcript_15426/g.46955  ORF Transcript_15426/g.46955 Transcript_15426/m.46955 type:complete len:217 (-) Transcript_15426:1113-1763(-)
MRTPRAATAQSWTPPTSVRQLLSSALLRLPRQRRGVSAPPPPEQAHALRPGRASALAWPRPTPEPQLLPLRPQRAPRCPTRPSAFASLPRPREPLPFAVAPQRPLLDETAPALTFARPRPRALRHVPALPPDGPSLLAGASPVPPSGQQARQLRAWPWLLQQRPSPPRPSPPRRARQLPLPRLSPQPSPPLPLSPGRPSRPWLAQPPLSRRQPPPL